MHTCAGAQPALQLRWFAPGLGFRVSGLGGVASTTVMNISSWSESVMHVLTAAVCRPSLCLWAVQARVGVPVVNHGGRCVRRAHLRQTVPGRNSGISPHTTHTHTCAPSRVGLAICLPTCSLSQCPSNSFYTRYRTHPCAWRGVLRHQAQVACLFLRVVVVM
jgi:hypothetical protein